MAYQPQKKKPVQMPQSNRRMWNWWIWNEQQRARARRAN